MPVAIFEAVHDRLACIIIGNSRTRPHPGRRIGKRRRTHLARAWIIGKRNTEPRAAWLLDEAQGIPAGEAKRSAIADSCAADQAMRRSDEVAYPSVNEARTTQCRSTACASFATACLVQDVPAITLTRPLCPEHSAAKSTCQACRRTMNDMAGPPLLFDRRAIRRYRRRAFALGLPDFLNEAIGIEIADRCRQYCVTSQRSSFIARYPGSLASKLCGHDPLLVSSLPIYSIIRI